MPYKIQFDPLLADLPLTARPYVQQLKRDSDQLNKLTHYDDPGEGARAVTLLAVLVIRGLATDCSRESPDAENIAMTAASMVNDFGEYVAYRQRVDAGQNKKN